MSECIFCVFVARNSIKASWEQKSMICFKEGAFFNWQYCYLCTKDQLLPSYNCLAQRTALLFENDWNPVPICHWSYPALKLALKKQLRLKAATVYLGKANLAISAETRAPHIVAGRHPMKSVCIWVATLKRSWVVYLGAQTAWQLMNHMWMLHFLGILFHSDSGLFSRLGKY